MRRLLKPMNYLPPVFGPEPEAEFKTKKQAIYPAITGLDVQNPWRLLRDSEVDALTPGQISELAERFDLTLDLVRDLSRELAATLHEGSLLGAVEVEKEKAAERGSKGLLEALERSKKVSDQLNKCGNALQPLGGEFTYGAQPASDLLEVKESQQVIQRLVNALVDDLSKLSSQDQPAFVFDATDLRKVSDRRRIGVVYDCCLTWRAAGKPVTYTTTPDGSKRSTRGGPLIEFVQTIVALNVTSPNFILSADTIQKDIEAFKKLPSDAE
ncbi:hypothetical protein EU805_16450 [Salipiger sp. IMCC34102]|uniref:hypothetical protein n=1 Tax=Salipiger sp. IMCC34102 TaxID=2510647 RepID=UPI00101CA80F|nr:hypothetical protein [Salipiger sp. IMCC34102]RYH00900.1 hypothetical protein EU805_16450 [Salipiger sp. IMCC34102]